MVLFWEEGGGGRGVSLDLMAHAFLKASGGGGGGVV